MSVLMQTLGLIRHFPERVFTLLGSEFNCRDCVYHATCSLPPDHNCILTAERIANRENRPPHYRPMIDWWCGLGSY